MTYFRRQIAFIPCDGGWDCKTVYRKEMADRSAVIYVGYTWDEIASGQYPVHHLVPNYPQNECEVHRHE